MSWYACWMCVLVEVGLIAADKGCYVATPGLLPLLGQPPFAAGIRAMYLSAVDLIERAKARTLSAGWTHIDPALIAAQKCVRQARHTAREKCWANWTRRGYDAPTRCRG